MSLNPGDVLISQGVSPNTPTSPPEIEQANPISVKRRHMTKPKIFDAQIRISSRTVLSSSHKTKILHIHSDLRLLQWQVLEGKLEERGELLSFILTLQPVA
jgi:hypothetical protein